MAVYRFVTQREAETGKIPSWRQLVKEWNLDHASDDWAYKDHRCFARDYHSTKEQLLTSISPSTMVALRDLLLPEVVIQGPSGKLYEPGWPE